jgi:alpha-1,2-mannosyltransferase
VSRLRKPLELGLFVEVPLIVVVWLASDARHGGFWFWDFEIFRSAGHAVVHGHSPLVRPTHALLAANDRFVYPTPFAVLFAPFNLIPLLAAKLVFLALSIGAVLLALRCLGVQDYRCYGAALYGAPVVVALAIGTIGPLLLLLVALGWRFRDRTIAGVPLALAAAAKLFLWPVLVWLLVTRRLRASAVAVATLALVAAAWLAVDAHGLRDYPTTLRVLEEVQRWKTYSLQSLAFELGASGALSVAVSVAAAAVGVVLIAAVARRENGDAAALSLAVVVAVLASPIVWLHYLALLFVPIALARPRLAPLWFLPVALWISPRTDSAGVTWKMGLIVAATLAVGLVSLLRAPLRDRLVALGRPARA